MEDIIEHYGASLLQMLGGIGVLGLYVGMMQQGGVLHEIVQAYMSGICG